jgi:hypothetical protein
MFYKQAFLVTAEAPPSQPGFTARTIQSLLWNLVVILAAAVQEESFKKQAN